MKNSCGFVGSYSGSIGSRNGFGKSSCGCIKRLDEFELRDWLLCGTGAFSSIAIEKRPAFEATLDRFSDLTVKYKFYENAFHPVGFHDSVYSLF
jgi:hypothetical protein